MSPFRYTENHNCIFLVTNQLSDECSILQQPISYEQAIVLKKISDSIGLDYNSLYITNGLKCTGNGKVSCWKSCKKNLDVEIQDYKPKSIVYCGKDTSKLKIDRTIIMDSLYTLLGSKYGISALQHTLRILKESHFV